MYKKLHLNNTIVNTVYTVCYILCHGYLAQYCIKLETDMLQMLYKGFVLYK